MPDIHHCLKIRARPEPIYRALTTSEGIRSWWTRDADVEPRPGGSGVFRFNRNGAPSEITVRIDAMEPPHRVAWATTSSFHASWLGTAITFTLRGEEGQTTLLFAHCGFQQADEGYATFTTGWAYYLVSLRQYLETGAGAPNPDIDFARMLR